MDYQTEGDHILVNCGQKLDREALEMQKGVLIQILAAKKNIIFQTNELTKVDTPALQLLLSFTRAAGAQNISWEWHEPAKVLVQVANLLGMEALLKLQKL